MSDLVTIGREALKGKIDRGEDFVLVETLLPAAYREAHLPGAINFPPDRVSELATALFPDRETEIIVYCASPS
jgi:rhodanese-related sulfurtransferase